MDDLKIVQIQSVQYTEADLIYARYVILGILPSESDEEEAELAR